MTSRSATGGTGDDVDEAVAVRMQRQEVLSRPGRTFHFLVGEAVLYARNCPDAVRMAQIDRLIAATALRGVRLGVVPFSARVPVSPIHGFWLVDQAVLVETFAAELRLTGANELHVYETVFDRLASVAVYETDARQVMHRAMRHHEHTTRGV